MDAGNKNDMKYNDSYRQIRTNLMLRNQNSSIRHIAFISGITKERTATIVKNLAVSFTGIGKHVLLINTNDCSMAQDALSNQADKGLLNILDGSITFENALQRNVLLNIDFIPRGSSNTQLADLFCREIMNDLMQKHTKEYDYVFWEMSPLLMSSESILISSMVDGVVLIFGSNVTTLKEAQEIKKSIEDAHGNILGVILDQE